MSLSEMNPEFWLQQAGRVPMWHTDYNQSITEIPDLNSLCFHRINFFHSKLSTTTGKTQELPQGIRAKTVDLLKGGMEYNTISKKLGQKVTAASDKMTINRPQPGAPRKIFPQV